MVLRRSTTLERYSASANQSRNQNRQLVTYRSALGWCSGYLTLPLPDVFCLQYFSTGRDCSFFIHCKKPKENKLTNETSLYWFGYQAPVSWGLLGSYPRVSFQIFNKKRLELCSHLSLSMGNREGVLVSQLSWKGENTVYKPPDYKSNRYKYFLLRWNTCRFRKHFLWMLVYESWSDSATPCVRARIFSKNRDFENI